MRFAYRAAIGAAFIVLAVLTLSARLIAQQAKETASRPSSRETARTPWGDPDLQGIWTNQTKTPFERPRPGEKPPVNEEAGPEVGAAGNTPVLKDLLGNPTYQRDDTGSPEEASGIRRIHGRSSER
jgi:hypothetical protein